MTANVQSRPPIPPYPAHLYDSELSQERRLASTPPRPITPATRQPSDEEAKSSPEGSPPKFTAKLSKDELRIKLETYTSSVGSKESKTRLDPLDFYKMAQAYQQSGDDEHYRLFLKAALASKNTSLAFPDKVIEARNAAETELRASDPSLSTLPPAKQKKALKTAHKLAWEILLDVQNAEFARSRAARARKPTPEEERESHYSFIARSRSEPMNADAAESSAANIYRILVYCLSRYCAEKKPGYAGSDHFPYYLGELTDDGVTAISTILVNTERLNEQIQRALQDPKACPPNRFTAEQRAGFHANVVALLKALIRVSFKTSSSHRERKVFFLLTVLPELGMRRAGSEQPPSRNPLTGELICTHNGRLSYYLNLTPSELERVLLPHLTDPQGILYQFVAAYWSGGDYLEKDNQCYHGYPNPIKGVSEATIGLASNLSEVAKATIDSLKVNIQKASTLTGIHKSWMQPNGHYKPGAYATLPKSSRDTLCVHENEPETKSGDIGAYYNVINIREFFRSPLSVDLASQIDKLGREKVVDAIVHQLASNRNTLVTLWLILYKLHHRDADIHPTNNFSRDLSSRVWKMNPTDLHQFARETLDSLLQSKPTAINMLSES